jgi:hypothetical protein
LEKEIKRLKEAQVCVWLLVIINFTWPASWNHFHDEQAETERSRVSRRASSTWEDESEIKALEYVFAYYYVSIYLVTL